MTRSYSVFCCGLLAAALSSIGQGYNANAQAVLSAHDTGVSASPEGRLQIGRGTDYTASSVDAQKLFNNLRDSMKKRRDFAWRVTELMLQPTEITLLDGVSKVQVPLWQTWYEGRPSGASRHQEINEVFKLYFRKLKPVLEANPKADVKPVIKATLKEFATKNLSASLTDENLSSVLHQHVDSALAGKILGQGTTIFSPSFLEHVMQEARGINTCTPDVAKADTPPPSPTEFSHCMKEFPRSAVMIKTSWRRLMQGVPNHSTDAVAMRTIMKEGTWPSIRLGEDHPTRQVPLSNPDRSKIYTNITTSGQEWALTGIHFVTKDVREWVWVSLWWDPDASKDFGADRPTERDEYDVLVNGKVEKRKFRLINNGPWKNYKLCVNTAFAEGDATPWSTYTSAQSSLGESIKAVYDAIESQLKNGAQMAALGQSTTFTPLSTALGPWPAPFNKQTSWCSNPNIETHGGNARTSCIGCHQIAFTNNEMRPVSAGGNLTPTSFTHAIIGDFPQFGRARARQNFTAEFSWSFQIEFRRAIDTGIDEARFRWPTN